LYYSPVALLWGGFVLALAKRALVDFSHGGGYWGFCLRECSISASEGVVRGVGSACAYGGGLVWQRLQGAH